MLSTSRCTSLRGTFITLYIINAVDFSILSPLLHQWRSMRYLAARICMTIRLKSCQFPRRHCFFPLTPTFHASSCGQKTEHNDVLLLQAYSQWLEGPKKVILKTTIWEEKSTSLKQQWLMGASSWIIMTVLSYFTSTIYRISMIWLLFLDKQILQEGTFLFKEVTQSMKSNKLFV